MNEHNILKHLFFFIHFNFFLMFNYDITVSREQSCDAMSKIKIYSIRSNVFIR